ncbi:MAG: D-alanine--D-alanine ligase [Candidatus Saccharibacteria bacterium]|nr:D-alanine--D-alanine ligase [Candidatus Saccharibacteria bacterium]MDB5181177.1 D-alanine--D-alanine ligase [Candidatus Saccharibacteria bacterium]
MKKTVAVYFGGRSTEHDISIITALSSVIKPLEMAGQYTIIPVYITKQGRWISGPKLKDISLFSSGKIEDFIKKAKPVTVTFDGGFMLNKTRIDINFPAMHGSFGEDGSLMGVFRMAGIPFVGADMDSSVIAMDKVLAKQVAEANNIPTSKFVFLTRDEFLADQVGETAKVAATLSYPLFVKPAHLGSSIGITRVTTEEELHNALEVAAYYDNKIIVEEAVANLIEVTVPIIGNKVPKPALIERPLATADEFFDFENKYIRGGGKKTGGAKQTGSQGYSELPVVLPEGLDDKVLQTAIATYKALGLQGMGRVDLLIDSKSQTVYFNEVNPLPGSIYAHNWRAAGVSTVDLVNELVQLAEQRFSDNSQLNTTFSSSFLQQF